MLERWTQDRSVIHLRILRAQPQQQLPPVPMLPALQLAGLSGGPAESSGQEEEALQPNHFPLQLQAMLGAAAEAAKLEQPRDVPLPPPPPQQQQQQLPEAPSSVGQHMPGSGELAVPSPDVGPTAPKLEGS